MFADVASGLRVPPTFSVELPAHQVGKLRKEFDLFGKDFPSRNFYMTYEAQAEEVVYYSEERVFRKACPLFFRWARDFSIDKLFDSQFGTLYTPIKWCIRPVEYVVDWPETIRSELDSTDPFTRVVSYLGLLAGAIRGGKCSIRGPVDYVNYTVVGRYAPSWVLHSGEAARVAEPIISDRALWQSSRHWIKFFSINLSLKKSNS